jgi:hypothetical protein
MRRGVNLESQLDAYEALSAVGSGAAAKKRQRSWPVYAAAAGSGLAMATSAEAGIVYSGPQNVTLAPGATGGSDRPINIDGHGHSFVLAGCFYNHLATAPHFISGAVGGLGLGGLKVLQTGSVDLKKLASGAAISHGAGGIRTV